jgi:hypothetical protein
MQIFISSIHMYDYDDIGAPGGAPSYSAAAAGGAAPGGFPPMQQTGAYNM